MNMKGTWDDDPYGHVVGMDRHGNGNGNRNGYEQGADDRYVWRYILLLKSFTVYGLDIFVAVTMISSEHVRLPFPPSPPHHHVVF
jgi:hypothetical protein